MEQLKTRVKVCGITRLDDAIDALDSGVDALGFVFYAPSPRAISARDAQKIIENCPPFFTRIGLFVNTEAQEVQSVLNEVKLDVLQFHGDETNEFCSQFNLPFIKALRVRNTQELVAQDLCFPNALAFLLDTYNPEKMGGTGEVFDWSLIPKLSKPIILAGGLNAQNVASAIDSVKPYAVDVSGGVEQAKGIKDRQKMQQFMLEVFHANQQLSK